MDMCSSNHGSRPRPEQSIAERRQAVPSSYLNTSALVKRCAREAGTGC
jgi:hypothetical protein